MKKTSITTPFSSYLRPLSAACTRISIVPGSCVQLVPASRTWGSYLWLIPAARTCVSIVPVSCTYSSIIPGQGRTQGGGQGGPWPPPPPPKLTPAGLNESCKDWTFNKIGLLASLADLGTPPPPLGTPPPKILRTPLLGHVPTVPAVCTCGSDLWLRPVAQTCGSCGSR